MKISIPNRIDYIATRALRQQTEKDAGLLLWSQSDEVIEKYVERATSSLQDSGRIPFYDGATENPRYEEIITTVAEEMFADDKYQNA